MRHSLRPTLTSAGQNDSCSTTASATHDWWYRCQERAGLVAPGQTSGAKMHRSRYRAGQRVLDATGNLKAAQALLGHASISTTADTYTDWDVERLESSLRQTFAFEAGE